MTRTVYPRSTCLVPFCRRWSTRMRDEWICGEHWRLVDRGLKMFWRKQLRKLHQRWETADARADVADAKMRANSPDGAHFLNEDVNAGLKALRARARANNRWWAASRTIWAKMKRQAIERAAGMAA